MKNINSTTKRVLQYAFFAVISIAAISCSDKDKLSENSVIDAGTTQQEKTELDIWIKEQITSPYGIEVVYYWDKNTAAPGSYTYPPQVEKVKPVLEAIKYLGLQLFQHNSIGGADFWKEKNPLKIYLYGGRNLDNTGKELIGNENSVGREIFIYNVNNFDPKNKEKVYVLMRSVFHQFAKLLAEIYPYNRENFALISEKDYRESESVSVSRLPQDGVAIYTLQYYPKKRDLPTCPYGIPFQYFDSEQACIDAHKKANISDDCYFCNYTQEYVNKSGFFTLHSIFSPEEDFAEVVSVFLTNSPQKIENAKRVAAIPMYADTEEEIKKAQERAENAVRCLNEKQQFVEEYFRKEIGISIKRLQLLSLQRMNTFLNQ